MRTTTYKCDRCGAESTNSSDLNLKDVRVGIGTSFGDYSARAINEWCTKCRIETGLQKPQPNMPDIKPVEPPLTLEDLVREIVENELQNQ